MKNCDFKYFDDFTPFGYGIGDLMRIFYENDMTLTREQIYIILLFYNENAWSTLVYVQVIVGIFCFSFPFSSLHLHFFCYRSPLKYI